MSFIPPANSQTPINAMNATTTTSEHVVSLPYDPAKAELDVALGEVSSHNVSELSSSLLVPEELTKIPRTGKEAVALNKALDMLALDAIRVGITLQKKTP